MSKPKSDPRGLAIRYIAKTLKIPLRTYCAYFSNNKGESMEESAYRYALGKGFRKGWSFDDFFQKAKDAVLYYCEYEDSPEKRERVKSLWAKEEENIKQQCAVFFFNPNIFDQNFSDAKIKMVQIIEPFFLKLEDQTAYKLHRNLPAYASVSFDDVCFVSAILSLTQSELEKLKADMLQMETVSSEKMLETLKNDEVRHWVDIRNQDYRDICRKGNNVEKSWARAKAELEKLPLQQLLPFGALFFVMFFTSPAEENCYLDETRFTASHVDLLLLFKYCLTENAQKGILETLKF